MRCVMLTKVCGISLCLCFLIWKMKIIIERPNVDVFWGLNGRIFSSGFEPCLPHSKHLIVLEYFALCWLIATNYQNKTLCFILGSLQSWSVFWDVVHLEHEIQTHLKEKAPCPFGYYVCLVQDCSLESGTVADTE